MKTYKHLWEQFISPENFELAAKNAIKHKKSKQAVKIFLKNKDAWLHKLRTQVITGNFKTSKYQTFTIYEPKKRVIYKLPLYPDHILQHALINVLGPIWQRGFIQDSYACIPGRGLHRASQRTMDFVRRNKYVLQCDIKKFYPSINHDIMMKIIAHKIHDRRILKVLNEIVRSVGGNTNLPIGNLTSQWMGNVYMNQLDMFIKQELHWADYIRYCDDFCLYSNKKSELKRVAKIIKLFINQNLELVFSKSDIRQTKQGVCFIGYRHFKKFILLKKRTAKKIKTRIKNIFIYNDFCKRTTGQIAAVFGWVKWACCFNYRNSLMMILSKTLTLATNSN